MVLAGVVSAAQQTLDANYLSLLKTLSLKDRKGALSSHKAGTTPYTHRKVSDG